MTNTACDIETCEECEQPALTGLDVAGRCETCATGGPLTWALPLMAAGVTRDKTSGRFVRVARDRYCATCGNPEGGDPAYGCPSGCSPDNLLDR